MATLAFIDKEINRKKSIKAGIISNPEKWEGSGITPTSIQAEIDELELKKKKVLDGETGLHQLRLEAHEGADVASLRTDQLELKVKGIHFDEPKKWAEYGLSAHDSLSTPPQQRPIPEKGKVINITVDTEKEGLIVKGETLKDADLYEWQRGECAAIVLDTVPPMKPLITTKSSKVVDNGVVRGIRYYYRYRGNNVHGFGEWSDPSNGIY